ncbi:glycosyltransferase family 4 protein [Stenotrophomonas sp. Iso1]|uniref:glycosyltransferase family 4 protein n=1 Tax=Stenotrophomonas sp. Iso1 TaxID=2977283 RepID=UPI0022B77838|nr:glycosyltransferase family 4 protein [Stenotrophomonas sp. Iso1]
MNQSKPQILVVAKAYPPIVGGVETYSEALVRAYMRRGLEPTVLTQTTGRAGWHKVEYPEGSIDVFNTGAGNQAWVFCRFMAAMARLHTKRRFAFMHATTWRPALAILPFTRNTLMLITVHGREVMNYPWILKRPMIELLRRADMVITVSHATMEIARTALHGRSVLGRWIVAFNGISYPDEAKHHIREPTATDRPVRLLSLARLVPRKNIQGCISALGELHAEGINGFEYWVAGTGPMEQELRAAVLDLGLQEHVRFLGYVPTNELTSLYQNADVFLHPQTNVGEGNDFEGFGLVIADAMSFGCAVVAGEAGGPRDFIQNNSNGILVDGLNGSDLKSAIIDLINKPDLRERLSECGQAYAITKLSWDAHVDQIMSSIPPSRHACSAHATDDH